MAVTHKLASADTLELSLIGAIGDNWDEEPITAKAVKRALKEAPNASLIKAYVESFGGSYFEGLAIYQLLSEHPARVEVEIGACAASAASLIAMAGDSISMHETSTMLVHEVWTLAVGKASDLRKEADDLDLLSGQAAIAYSSRTGMTVEATAALMAEDRFMGANEAKHLGFCTEIRKSKPKGKSNSAPMTERHVRSQLAAIRTEAEERASGERLAASAPKPTEQNDTDPSMGSEPTPQSSEAATENQPPAPAAPVAIPPKETQMTFALSLAALGLPEGATDSELNAKITEIKASADAGTKLCASLKAKSADEALGTIVALQANAAQTDGDGYVKVMSALGASSADEALGIVEAFKSATSRLADTEARLADLELKQTTGERNELIAKLRSEGKITPAQEETVLPSMSLATLQAFAKTAVPVMRGDGKREPTNKGYQGKPYDKLTNVERAELKRTDPETFNQLRQQAINSGAL
jgi:ATP-dependent protease ClpP protease subunit